MTRLGASSRIEGNTETPTSNPPLDVLSASTMVVSIFCALEIGRKEPPQVRVGGHSKVDFPAASRSLQLLALMSKDLGQMMTE